MKSAPVNRTIRAISVSSDDEVISKCYRCSRYILKAGDDPEIRCTSGHHWPDWVAFVVGYKRWSRAFIVFVLYSVLAAVACGMYALMHTNLSYAMWALAWVLIANLCALQLPSKE